MSISSIKKALRNVFQGILKNLVSLADDSPLDSHLKTLKIGDKSTPIELSESELKVNGTINAESINVNGSAVQTGTEIGATQLNELSDVTYANGDLTISSLDKIVAAGDLRLVPSSGGKLICDISDNDGNEEGFKIENTSQKVVTVTSESQGGDNVIRFWESEGTPADYFAIEVLPNGDTTLVTYDDAGANGHLRIQADGQLRINTPPRIAEQASADSDQAGYGQLWVKNDTPNNLYFTNDAGNDVQITNGSSLASAGGGGTDSWNWQQSTRWYTRYGYQYHPNSTYGPAYYNWSSAYQSLPASWPDDRNPMIVIPKNMTIKSYHLFGNFSSAQTYELTLRTGTPSYGSAGDTSLSTIGAATSLVVGTANINQKIEQTGLSVSVSAGDIIIPFLRRTTNTTSSSYYFCEGVLSIVGEYS